MMQYRAKNIAKHESYLVVRRPVVEHEHGEVRTHQRDGKNATDRSRRCVRSPIELHRIAYSRAVVPRRRPRN